MKVLRLTIYSLQKSRVYTGQADFVVAATDGRTGLTLLGGRLDVVSRREKKKMVALNGYRAGGGGRWLHPLRRSALSDSAR